MTPEQVYDRNRRLIMDAIDRYAGDIGMLITSIQYRLIVDHDHPLSCETLRRHTLALEELGWAERGLAVITNAAVWRLTDAGRTAHAERNRT